MTEETLIKNLKIEKKKWENKIYGVGETRIDLMIEDVIKALQTKQEEIEKKKEDIQKMQELLDFLDAKNVEKYKIINLMAEQLTTPVHSKEWVIDYYKKKVEEC